MSLTNLDTVAIFHIANAAWNTARFATCDPSDGFALTYFPFAAGTSLALAAASPRIRAEQALATVVLCTPHLMSEFNAQLHFSRSLLYLIGSKYGYNWWGEGNGGDISRNSKDSEPIPLTARILSGLLGLSQIGVSMLFTSNYLSGNPATYEAFLRDNLTTTDKVPESTLTAAFLRSVYLAGTYVVLGMGWSIGGNLTNAVLQNSALECEECLKVFAINLSTQVVLHSVGHLVHLGGEVESRSNLLS